MPPVTDASVSRNTYLGSDDATKATIDKGMGAIVVRNGKRIFDFEFNENTDLIRQEGYRDRLDIWTDGVLNGNVFKDGVSQNSFAVSYGAGILTVAAGRLRLGGFICDLKAAITNAAGGNPMPGITAFALPAGGHVQLIYVDIYNREVETNGNNPYADATPASNGNDPYLVTPKGEMARRYQYFNFRTDVTFVLDALPAPVAGHRYIQLASISSAGVVTDTRALSKVQGVFLPGGVPLVNQAISANTITPEFSADIVISATGVLNNLLPSYVSVGAHIMLRAAAGQTVTLTHAAGGAGQLILASEINASIDTVNKCIILKYNGTNWIEVCRNWSTGKQSQGKMQVITATGDGNFIVPDGVTDLIAELIAASGGPGGGAGGGGSAAFGGTVSGNGGAGAGGGSGAYTKLGLDVVPGQVVPYHVGVHGNPGAPGAGGAIDTDGSDGSDGLDGEDTWIGDNTRKAAGGLHGGKGLKGLSSAHGGTNGLTGTPGAGGPTAGLAADRYGIAGGDASTVFGGKLPYLNGGLLKGNGGDGGQGGSGGVVGSGGHPGSIGVAGTAGQDGAIFLFY